MGYSLVHTTEALCAETDPELFFPTDTASYYSKAKYESKVHAKQICAKCPLTLQCLKSALVGKEEYGIWGGATSRERDRIKTKAQAEQFVLKLRKQYLK